MVAVRQSKRSVEWGKDKMNSRMDSSIRSRFLSFVLFLYAGLTVLVGPAFVYSVEAQQGPRTFKDAAKQIVDDVAPGAFGAMVVAITGLLALVAAVTGSYKGAWAVLYVSVGLYILRELVELLFTL